MKVGTISKTLLIALVFIIPLFFTNLTPEFFATGKEMLLFFAIPLIMLLISIAYIQDKKVEVAVSKLTLPVLGIAVAFIASNLIVSPNKIESLTNSTGTGVIIALTFLFFAISTIIKRRESIVLPIVITSSILSILYILQFFKVLQIIMPFPFITQNPFFTPAGTLLGLAIVLLATLPLTLEMALTKQYEDNQLSSIIGWVTTLIIALGFVVTLVSIIKDAKPPLLPFSISWSIAVDTLRNVKSAVFGVGPGNFVDMFTQSKPISINQTPYWNIRFGVAGSYILNLLTEVGALGVFFYLFTFIVVLSLARKHLKDGVFVSVIILFISSLFLPASITTLFFTFVLLGVLTLSIPKAHITENSVIFPRVSAVFWSIILLGVWYFSGRLFLSEYYFQKSIVAASQNNGLDTYNNQGKAISFNPYNDRFRVSYSQTNLALANSLSQNENPSDQDRQNISTLIQQAITEAKQATALNPRRATNWENLAVIYQAIINAAEGAGDWTIASLNQAVRLDPLNPNLRIGLGGVLYQLKNYDGAIQQFSIAAQLKPDFANAFYNLSAALKAKGDIQGAFTAMQNTVALVDPSSNDFNKASSELEELRRQLPQQAQTAAEGENTETLTEPGSPPVEIKPTVVIEPEDAAPVIPETSPTEEAQPTETQPTPDI